MGAAETSEGVEAIMAHSAVVRAPMARREGILEQVAEGDILVMAFELLVGIVSQRPALERVVVVREKKCSVASERRVLCFEVARGRKTSCCGEGELRKARW